MDHQAVLRKIHRMAWQILEHHTDTPELIIAGIKGSGAVVARMLAAELRTISDIAVLETEISLDKQHPDLEHISINSDPSSLQNIPAIVVDDVLNSGRTLSYAIMPFLKAGCPTVRTAVLVNRNHHHFPVAANYSGLSLATTLQEHIEVSVADGVFEVYLN
jgi:pyrimidine operon attenuation protein/uracil phosphoribosyltransferase